MKRGMNQEATGESEAFSYSLSCQLRGAQVVHELFTWVLEMPNIAFTVLRQHEKTLEICSSVIVCVVNMYR